MLDWLSCQIFQLLVLEPPKPYFYLPTVLSREQALFFITHDTLPICRVHVTMVHRSEEDRAVRQT